jgi:hypothetical protein
MPRQQVGSYRDPVLQLDLAVDLAFDLKRPVKPRWPEFDIEAVGKPARMPV